MEIKVFVLAAVIVVCFICGIILGSIHLFEKDINKKIDKMNNKYDADTVQGTPNFIPGKYAINLREGKDEYMGYIFDEFIKYPDDDHWNYDFILVNNGKIIAMGDEQVRCGGIIATCADKDFAERIRRSPAYDKVKHLPIASPKELEKPIYMYFNSQKEYEEFMERNKSL